MSWEKYSTSRSYMDIDTGDIHVVTDNGCGYSSVFHIKNKK